MNYYDLCYREDLFSYPQSIRRIIEPQVNFVDITEARGTRRVSIRSSEILSKLWLIRKLYHLRSMLRKRRLLFMLTMKN